ncbi:MAG: flotillin [Candidatus Latescibacteria bacterium]|nr:flotillin [Candidatus Latescibacterota bacterium]NIM66300.1 flotillin [Candidatus Latescibacterota bacterium]NIO02779.1 flotillin [Candidatus Latescibacterota bacterium]NIO29914.1 flotillin [Candidatus Latescibacterota bacterium]NIO57528.1 flotillin [Candidatus Latescibacterota bacterium]
MVGWLIWLIIGVAVLGLFLLAMWKQYRKVGPNEVLIISGGRRHTVVDPDGTKRKIGYRMQIGGGTFVLPFIESCQVLSLEIFTVGFKTPEVLTTTGVPVITEGLAQIKIKGDEYSIRLASEQFLGKDPGAIRDISQQILEGHMRSTIGSFTVEEMYQNRDGFALKVREAATKDFDRMGLQLISFSLKDLTDTQGYLEALGRPRIAEVKRDAAVAQAETDKDATIKAAIARKEGDIAKFQADTEIAQAHRDFESKRAEFQAVINQKKATADLAYDLEKLRVSEELKAQEYQVRLIEKEKSIEIEQKEIARRELELESTVKKEADARKYQAQSEAEAESYRVEAEAKAKAEAMKVEGAAEVEVMRAKGAAQSVGMKQKAEAWREYNEAAVYQMFIDVLPQLAKNVSEPLSKVEKIVLIGDGKGAGASRITNEVASVLAQMPEVLESLTGVDIKKLLQNLPEIAKRQKAETDVATPPPDNPSKGQPKAPGKKA